MPSHNPQTERFESVAHDCCVLTEYLDNHDPGDWTEEEAAALDGLRLRARQLFDVTTAILEEREP